MFLTNLKRRLNMCSNKYRVLQLTNNAIGAVTVTSFMPLGNVTRRINRCEANVDTFSTSTNGTNTVSINECGNYNITYNLSGIAATAGVLITTLVVNGVNVYSSSATAAVGDTANITLTYQIRVLPNCSANPTNVPTSVQIQLNGVGITGGTSNLRVERVY